MAGRVIGGGGGGGGGLTWALLELTDAQMLNSHCVLKGAEVAHLCAEHQVTQLCIGEKDDEEHDCKTTNIFCALKEKKEKRYYHINFRAELLKA